MKCSNNKGICDLNETVILFITTSVGFISGLLINTSLIV